MPVDRSIVERLLPGDWVMIHWQAGTRPGVANHSMMFVEWQGPWRADGYRRARFANQGNNDIGGGSYTTVPVCADASKPMPAPSRPPPCGVSSPAGGDSTGGDQAAAAVDRIVDGRRRAGSGCK